MLSEIEEEKTNVEAGLKRSQTLSGQGGCLQEVDEEIDTDHLKSDTGVEYDRIKAEVFGRLKPAVLFHLTCALLVSSLVGALLVPALLGEQEKTLPNADAFEAMLIPSAAGAVSFATTVTIEMFVAEYLIGRAIHLLKTAQQTAQSLIGSERDAAPLQERLLGFSAANPVNASQAGDMVPRADAIDYDEMATKLHRPNARNLAYSDAIVILTGTFLFLDFNLADTGASIEGQQVSGTTLEKGLTYGTEMVVHTLGGAIFPAVLQLFDQGVRAMLEGGFGPLGLEAMQLPPHLAYVNAVALCVAEATNIALVETGYGEAIGPLYSMATTVAMAGIVAPGTALIADAYCDNRLSQGVNAAVEGMAQGLKGVGTMVVRVATCQDLRSSCPSNNDYHRLSGSSD